jgi:hypothetical protein
MAFLGNPSNGNRVDTYGKTDRDKDGRTEKIQREMTKLYALFSNYANAPKKRKVWRV